jgi:hypothetical protein
MQQQNMSPLSVTPPATTCAMPPSSPIEAGRSAAGIVDLKQQRV